MPVATEFDDVNRSMKPSTKHGSNEAMIAVATCAGQAELAVFDAD